jgi:hypothetical protein
MEAVTAISSVGAKTKLTPEELAEVAKLAARDREVRMHEAAHMAASGGLRTGGAEYVYQRGPDGKMYAVGGKVHIEVSPGQTPQETLAKARQLRAAATAPSDPSSQDRAVAAAAAQMELAAMQQIAQEKKAAKTATSGGNTLADRSTGAFRGFSMTA